jgi:hypothetical protein
LEIVNEQLRRVRSALAAASADAVELGEDLLKAGAPWVEGNPLPQLELK